MLFRFYTESELENTHIGSKRLIDYLHGDCHKFAYLLAHMLEGCRPFIIWDKDFEGNTILQHVAVEYGFHVIDIRGVMERDIFSILEDFDYDVPYMEYVSQATLRNRMVTNVLATFDASELDNLKYFISNNFLPKLNQKALRLRLVQGRNKK